MTHFRKVCKHGVVRSQCRCASPNKISILVECPLSHGEWFEKDYPVVYTGTIGQQAVPVSQFSAPETKTPVDPELPLAVTWGKLADVIEAEGRKLAADPPEGFTFEDQKASIPVLYLVAGVVRTLRELDNPPKEE